MVGCAAAVAAGALGQTTTAAPATAPSAAPATAPAAARAAATGPADADVLALIRKLGADETDDRNDAQRQLVDRGETAVDALRQAADHDPDPEVRSRSNGVLAQIRDRDVNGPTLITLHAHGAPLASVLTDLGNQAHADITQPFGGGKIGGRVGEPTVTLDADRKPFWEVMSDVCGQANVCPLPIETSNHQLQLYRSARNWLAKGPHQVVGPFCIGVSGLYHMMSVELSGPPMTDDLFFARLVVFPEPKLVVTQMSPLVVREAVDDAGNSLMPPPPAVPPGAMRAVVRASSMAASRTPARTVEAKLKFPPDHAGKRIATLAGDLTVTLAQGAQPFEADDIMAHPTVTRPLPGVRVRVSVAHPVAGLAYQVTIECTRDGMDDQQWYAMTNRLSDVTVQDAAGHQLSPPYFWSADAGNTDSSFKATGPFIRTNPNNQLLNRMAAIGGNNPAAAPQPGEPNRLVWNVAARFKVVTVPVAFHDLPMP